jgi:hypothetical protein
MLSLKETFRNKSLRLSHLILLIMSCALLSPRSLVAWTSPVNISRTRGFSGRPAIAMDTSGGIHVVWRDDSNDSPEIYYGAKAVGYKWRRPRNISRTSGVSGRPAIAVDANGIIHVVWRDNTSGNTEIYYARRPVGYRWTMPTNISNTPGETLKEAVAADHTNNVHVLLEDKSSGIWQIYYTKTEGHAWTDPVDISNAPENSAWPSIVVGPNNDLHTIYGSYISNNMEIVYSCSENTGGDWTDPINVSSTVGRSERPSIAVDNQNNLYVVWCERFPNKSEIYYSENTGGDWTDPINISDTLGLSERPAVVADLNNAIHVVWQDSSPGIAEIYYTYNEGSGWTSPVNISNSPGRSFIPSMAVGPDNALHVVWEDNVSGNYEILYATNESPQDKSGK